MEYEVILIRYYNVQFLLEFQIGMDELKKTVCLKCLNLVQKLK